MSDRDADEAIELFAEIRNILTGGNMKKQKVVVVQPEHPVKREILAEAIIRISDSIRKLCDGGINRKAVTVLLKHSTGLTMGQIENVLDSIIDLKAMYCR